MNKLLRGLSRTLSFRNNYLALSILAVLLSTLSYGQYDSTKNRQVIAGYGFDWKNTRSISSLVIPTTLPILALKDSGGIAFSFGKLWTWTGVYWKAVTGEGTFSAPGVDSVVIRFGILCQWVEGSPTCYSLVRDTVIFKYPLEVIVKEVSGAAHDSIRIKGSSVPGQVLTTGADSSIVGWQTPTGGGGSQNLQGVTDNGNATTRWMVAKGLNIKTGTKLTFNIDSLGTFTEAGYGGNIIFDKTTGNLSMQSSFNTGAAGGTPSYTNVPFTIKNTAQIVFGNYGGGFFNGTGAYNLGVDASGNVITVPSGGGGVTDTTFRWSVLDSLNTPPGSPTDGDIYEVGTAGTGAFSGHNKEIVTRTSGAWTFETANTGDLLYNVANDIVSKFNAAWVRTGKVAIHQGLDHFGAKMSIGTSDFQDFAIGTNGSQRLRVTASGGILINNLIGTGNGIVGVNSGGTLTRLATVPIGNIDTTITGLSSKYIRITDGVSYNFTSKRHYDFLRLDTINNQVVNSRLTVLPPLIYNYATNTLSADTSTATTGLATKFNASGGGGSSYTFSTGLTNASGTITNNLSTGVSGGQTLIGSTSTTSGLTYKATTGVGTTGADHIFTVGNNGATEAVRILNSGNVGINIAAPLSKLHINDVTKSGNGSSTLALGVGTSVMEMGYNTAGGYGFLNVVDPGVQAKKLAIGTGVTSNIAMGTTTFTSDFLNINGVVDVTGLKIGNVSSLGVGGQLQLNGTFDMTNGSIETYIINGTNGAETGSILGVLTNNHLWFRTNNVTRAVLTSGGNFGIGNAVPSAIFQIKKGGSASGTAPMKFSTGQTQIAAIATTAATSDPASIMTVSFAALAAAPDIGSTVTVAGVTSSTFNGTFEIIASTTSSVSYQGLGCTSCTATVQGTIKILSPKLTTAAANAIEYDGANMYMTDAAGTRYSLTKTIIVTAAPTTTPTTIGDQAVDITNKKIYIATGNASSADWTIVN